MWRIDKTLDMLEKYHNLSIPKKILLWLLLVVLFSGFFALKHRREKEVTRIEAEYPLLDEYENIYTPVRGIVANSERDLGGQYITLTNGQKFRLAASSRNVLCDPEYLTEFIQPGDSLLKAKDDIYIFVVRKNKRYVFKMLETIKSKSVDIRTERKPEQPYKEINKVEFLELLAIDKDSLRVEVSDLYPATKVIPEDETSFICKELKKKGFGQIGSSRGNWEHGPRIVTFIMAKKTVKYQVDKMYYTTGDPYEYLVTERIKKIDKYE